ncbi:hypothetical protein [Pilimelia columellifera]|uniref:XRE family transcriptional regulator n=1 Tax=Pilimelia columellifera subsp. columellifera TaxID=706583 RepID=A0ABN3NBG6_9ACTN
MSGDDFAAMLGASGRGVVKWEAAPDAELALRSQELLDTALERTDANACARFVQLLDETEPQPNRPTLIVPEPQAMLIPRQRVSAGGVRTPTPELVESLRRSLRDHYTADNLLGPRALLPVITAYAETVEQVRRNASGKLLDDLLGIGAGYAEFAGWLSQDAGELDAATHWYRRALEWAECGRDDRMASFVLTRRAAQAVSARDGDYAARLARAAQRGDSPLTTRVRAIAVQTEALGHAIAGNPNGVDDALERAAALVDSEGEAYEGDPSAGRYCEMPLYLAISTAKCQLELGRAGAAIDGFTAVLNALPADYHRDRGQYLARLAHAYALAGQPDEACGNAEESLAIALATGSSRTLVDLRGIAGYLDRWATYPTVSQLRERLETAAV